jgi:hypothetical protein
MRKYIIQLTRGPLQQAKRDQELFRILEESYNRLLEISERDYSSCDELLEKLEKQANCRLRYGFLLPEHRPETNEGLPFYFWGNERFCIGKIRVKGEIDDEAE